MTTRTRIVESDRTAAIDIIDRLTDPLCTIIDRHGIAGTLADALRTSDADLLSDTANIARNALGMICGYCGSDLDEPGDYCSRGCWERDGGWR